MKLKLARDGCVLVVFALLGCGQDVAIPTPCAIPRDGIVRVGVTDLQVLLDRHTLSDLGMRPISVSATGVGPAARYDVIWVEDAFGRNGLWDLHIDLTADEFDALQALPDQRPIAIDEYGPADSPRYIVAWVSDGILGRSALSLSADELEQTDAAFEEDGYSPVWVDARFNGSVTRYSALWSGDSIQRALDLDLPAPVDADAWQDRTDGGWRLLRMTLYDRLLDEEDEESVTERAHAAVWQMDPAPCLQLPWMALNNQPQNSIHHTVRAHGPEGPTRTLDNVGNLAISGSDLPNRLTLQGPLANSETLLRSIQVTGPPPEDGHTLVLQTRPGHSIVVSDDALGNVRLRRWDADVELDPDEFAAGCAVLGVTCGGQVMRLNDYDSRLVLLFDAANGEWHEFQRNGLAPDRYAPIAMDAMSEADSRRISSVWVGHRSERRFLVRSGVTPEIIGAATPADLSADSLFSQFDDLMRGFMERRLLPGVLLGLVADGRLVLSRSYSYLPPEWGTTLLPDPQTALFRTASISKSLTAIAIMRLVADGDLQLDQTLGQIPGLFDLLGDADWDPRVAGITIRQLLGHLGGWDRDLSPDFTINQNFQICRQIDPRGLPTDIPRILAYTRSFALDHSPGEWYAYSNFGYTILGRVIEAVTGMGYEQYVRETLLLPIQATSTFVHLPGPGGTLSREIRYYTPLSTMGANAFGLGVGPHHPLRDECSANHADRVSAAYGPMNIGAMDAHGGWLSSVPDLLRVMVALDDPDYLGPEARAEMWSRQEGRDTRVLTREGGADGELTDRSFDARMLPGNAPAAAPLSLLPAAGDQLLVGKGLLPFGRLDFVLTVPGDGYELLFEYLSEIGWRSLTEDVHALSDAGEGFSEPDANGNIGVRFDRPGDWAARTITEVDETPRFWVRVTGLTDPAFPAEASQVMAGAEVDYGLGWSLSQGRAYRHDLDLSLFDASVFGLFSPVGALVVGAESHASGNIFAVATAPGGTTLTLDSISGGSFRPGEPLHLGSMQGSLVGRVGDQRERPVVISAWHSGLLNGLVTMMKRRGDGFYWVVVINQRETGSSFFVRSHSPRVQAIDGLITALDNTFSTSPILDWPGWDLFP
jgi:CubicO group peptidase (beta-lactamase class C family)